MNAFNLEKIVAKITVSCPSQAVSDLQQVLSAVPPHTIPTLNYFIHRLQPPGVPPQLVNDLLQHWQRIGADKISGYSLSVTFGTSRETQQLVTDQSPKAELVWTGPYPPEGSPVRSTLSVLKEMITAARQHILLVGYSLSGKSDSAISVINNLAMARKNGCSITVAFHNDGANLNLFKELWPSGTALPKILFWADPTDSMTSIHAKLLSVDGEDLFVTSANLSHHGLDANMEVGIKISGPLAYAVNKQFAALETRGILVQV